MPLMFFKGCWKANEETEPEGNKVSFAENKYFQRRSSLNMQKCGLSNNQKEAKDENAKYNILSLW